MNAIMRRRDVIAVAALGLLSLCFSSLCSVAHADPGKEALVIGITRYPDAQLSGFDKATENDTKLMKEALEKRGFHVRVLLDSQATRDSILDALRSYPTGTDQFVLYYAGKSEYDVFNGKSWVYPFNTDTKAPRTWLSAAELRAAVEAVPAVSRTIILDTNAAGYLMNAPGQKWVCYCVSGQVGQRAAEGQFTKDDDFDRIASRIEINNLRASSLLGKEPAGIFTHALAMALGRGGGDQTWNQLMNEVATRMQHQLGSNQVPDLSPDFVNTRVFFISPVLLTRAPSTAGQLPAPIAQTTTRPAPVTTAPVQAAPTAAPPAATEPAQPAAKVFDPDASKRLVALWTGADGNPDEDKGRAMKVADVQAALKAGADPDAVDGAGLTLLIIAAGTNRADIAKIAIAAHCDINFKNDGLGTALVEAAYTGSIDVVKVLLDNNADLTATKEGGVTALGAAKSDYDGKTPDTIAKITALLTAKGATN